VNLDLDAVHHLLRHLNNVPKLRENVFVVNLCDLDEEPFHVVHARIREIVSSALDLTLAQHGSNDTVRASRWEAIVRGCDLDGKSHQSVADELGLSRRHFYRERRAAHEAIGRHVLLQLGGSFNAKSQTRGVYAEAEVLIEYASACKHMGNFADAVRVLEDIAGAAGDSTLRLHAVNELLEIYAQEGNAAAIGRLVDLARFLGDADPSNEGEVQAERLMAEAYAHGGRGAEYARSLQRALRHLTSSTPSPRTGELGVRASIALTQYFLIERGDAREAERYLATARSFLDRGVTLHPAFSIDFCATAGRLHLHTSGPGKASEAFAKGLAIARRHQVPYHMALTSYGLGHSSLERGDLNQAREHARNAVVLAEQIGWSKCAARSELLLAEIHLDSGDPQGALTWNTRLKERVVHDERLRITLSIISAETLDSLGRRNEALDVIDRCCSDIERRGDSLYLGDGELVRARIYSRMRRPAAARAAIAKAIELLERYGSMGQQARAYDLSARLTKNVRHRTRARELKEYLTR
jgi:tetratricopeptide (TPR) repeat protein